jgi:hypothetical protein
MQIRVNPAINTTSWFKRSWQDCCECAEQHGTHELCSSCRLMADLVGLACPEDCTLQVYHGAGLHQHGSQPYPACAAGNAAAAVNMWMRPTLLEAWSIDGLLLSRSLWQTSYMEHEAPDNMDELGFQDTVLSPKAAVFIYNGPHTACTIMEELTSLSQWKEGMWIPSHSTHVYTARSTHSMCAVCSYTWSVAAGMHSIQSMRL